MTPVFIYALLDPRTGELRYCGQTADPDERLAQHLREAKRHQFYNARWICSLQALRLKPVMEILDVVPDSEADFWETEYIQNFREQGFDLTNFSDGGGAPMRGKKHTSETREKIRVAHIGMRHTKEARAKISAAGINRNCTAETRAKMSEARAGEKHPFFGKHHTPESCAKSSATKKAQNLTGEKSSFFGRTHTPEAKEKNRQANLGRRAWNKGIAATPLHCLKQSIMQKFFFGKQKLLKLSQLLPIE